MNDLADLFSHLIADRPGNFATRIVDRLRAEEAFEVGKRIGIFLDLPAGGITVRSDGLSNRTTIYMDGEGDTLGPSVVLVGIPSRWGKLEAFRNAGEIDKAFRGHGQTFDAELPHDAA